MIVVIRHLVPKGFSGLTIYPFIFIKKSELNKDAIFINHEHIHLRQQFELLIIPFFIVYSLEFFIRLIQFRSWYLAYKNISFEREAYTHEKDLNYIQSRPFWGFSKYIKR